MTRDTDDLSGRIGVLESELAEHPSPRAFAPLAEAYRLEGRLEEALRTARAGAEAHPEHVGILVVLARALSDSDDREGAKWAYGKILELDPANVEAQAFAAAGEAAVVEGPEVGTAEELPGLGADAGSTHASPEAEDEGRDRDLPAVGTLSEELAHLADLFAPSVRAEARGGGEEGPFGIATLTLAEIYARQGLNAEAAEVCERILEREPENEEARLKLEEYRQHAAMA